VKTTALNFRSPVAVAVGIVLVVASLLLVAVPFSASGTSCGTALTPRTIRINTRAAAQDPERLVRQLRAQRDCDSGVQIRRLSGAALAVVGIAMIAIGATPRWRRRSRRKRRSRHGSSRPRSGSSRPSSRSGSGSSRPSSRSGSGSLVSESRTTSRDDDG
jgi:hypothetical protein